MTPRIDAALLLSSRTAYVVGIASMVLCFMACLTHGHEDQANKLFLIGMGLLIVSGFVSNFLLDWTAE